jgi:hypothetical protein
VPIELNKYASKQMERYHKHPRRVSGITGVNDVIGCCSTRTLHGTFSEEDLRNCIGNLWRGPLVDRDIEEQENVEECGDLYCDNVLAFVTDAEQLSFFRSFGFKKIGTYPGDDGEVNILQLK